jgi:hypothetical protein
MTTNPNETLSSLLARWDSNEGKPYKGSLIDWDAYEADPSNIGCMCAQGQVLHLLAGWTPEQLRYTDQDEADRETAERLNISLAHSILLRRINDNADGAPSIVLTHPEKVLGDQAHIVLAFWLHLDRMKAEDWKKVLAARSATQVATQSAAWTIAWVAARDAAAFFGDIAWDVARSATQVAARDAAGYAAWTTARDAAYACSEIQGARILRDKGQPLFFLPMFGFAEPEAIPPLPLDYGVTR